MDKLLNLKIEGDYFDGQFSMFLVVLERNNTSCPIYLTAEQTNLAFEYDDPFEPILSLKNILLESGFDLVQSINIVSGDDSPEQREFLAAYNDITEKAWTDQLQLTRILFVNEEDPMDSNLQIENEAGNQSFDISTETNEGTPFDLRDTLAVILAIE